MHTLYWRDLESPANGEWLGLAVQVVGGAGGAWGRAPIGRPLSFICNPAARPAFA
ncbi:hypothetical protein OV078_21585 [Pseudomonas aeruginosa]|uniref:hypothetical protein n=1 Tax=Pseudomonas aeruginosa TaxID=287 RepID=UPI00227224CA|nr:hypothetical protein [Pseudomonas aeruginosa]MCY0338357.1 hypothetical protein [Pseudomonas aeruginosa]